MKRFLTAGGLALFSVLALALTGPLSSASAQTSTPSGPTVITPQPPTQNQQDRTYLPPEQNRGQQPYASPPPSASAEQPYGAPRPEEGTYSDDEIMAAGHRFFGRVSVGLAKVIEYAFQKAGRPNGYILGEGAGGAFVAGLRYGEGMLYTKNAGEHKVFWQGPSIGYDFGAEGSKTMILVYNLQRVEDIYATFGGVDGSAYFIGGVGITFQTHKHVTLAPIRSGIGLRLGANVGYLKYTRRPTWNPF